MKYDICGKLSLMSGRAESDGWLILFTSPKNSESTKGIERKAWKKSEMQNLTLPPRLKIPWMEEPGRLQSMGSQSRTRLSDFLSFFLSTFTFYFHALEKEMGTHSSVACSLENSRDREAWWAAIYGVTQSRTRLKQLSSSNSSKSYRLDTCWVSNLTVCLAG